MAAEPGPSTDDVRIDLPARRLGSKVATLHNVGKSYGGAVVLRGVNASLQPGARIGIVGPNGSGKTTLLRMIAGHLEPDEGSIRRGSTVQIGWYGQHTTPPRHRQQVLQALQEVVRETNTAEGITLSATQLLERFAFPATLQQSYVSELSGGERRRLELLRVLATAPNLLLLDEPANDLDLDTLSELEGFLDTWSGALVVATHDRFFLDRVCSQLWSIEPDGTVRDHPGGWTAYRDHRARQRQPPTSRAPGTRQSRARTDRQARLSYSEQRELTTLERQLPQLEERRTQLNEALIDAAGDHVRVDELARALDAVVSELDQAETRWLELHLRTERTNEE